MVVRDFQCHGSLEKVCDRWVEELAAGEELESWAGRVNSALTVSRV
jgi:hypothetical protein